MKIKFFTKSIIVISCCFIVLSCKNDKHEYQNYINPDSLDNIPANKLKVYLETSVSMRGYVESQSKDDTNDYNFKKLPSLFSDLSDSTKYFKKTELFTVSDKISLYNKDINNYNQDISKGTIMDGKISFLHSSINEIIDSLKKGETALFITDNILDFGTQQKLANVSTLTNCIKDHLKYNEDLTVLLLQQLTDFNGNFYYCYDNTQPFRDSVMHKRPYYIWVFDRANKIGKLLKDGVFDKYIKNDVCFNYKPSIDFWKITNVKKEGSFLLRNYDSIEFKGYRNDTLLTFSLGIDLKTLPLSCQSIEYLEHNIKLDKEYLNPAIDVYTTENIKKIPEEYSKMGNEIEKFTHFIVISFNNKNIKNGFFNQEVKLLILQQYPDWISKSNIPDDLNQKEVDLETKTFSLSSLLEPFKDKYITEKNNKFIELKFKISK